MQAVEANFLDDKRASDDFVPRSPLSPSPCCSIYPTFPQLTGNWTAGFVLFGLRRWYPAGNQLQESLSTSDKKKALDIHSP
jgi:hypothetical protein